MLTHMEKQHIENYVDCHKINRYSTDEVTKLINENFKDVPLTERIDAVSYSQMFSFWKYVQDTLFLASEEIKRLNAKIKELEEKNVKVS